MVDYRFDRHYGWDSLGERPKVGDLVVITTDTIPEKGRVVMLFDDEANRQTVDVGLCLVSQYGDHIRLNRKDVRPLSSRDRVAILES